jgi:glutamate---cysteine ligase / carboxylate-amine ligase
VARPRHRELVSALRFVARQELIFGIHVHVAVDDPDKAIHVANGMRAHIPILLGLSANSPFWRAEASGLASTRTPIFPAFPRMGIPPKHKDWKDYEQRVEFMIHSRVIEDYTYLWHDVRPHPNFGTVEMRVMDPRLTSSTRSDSPRWSTASCASRASPLTPAVSCRGIRSRCSTSISG